MTMGRCLTLGDCGHYKMCSVDASGKAVENRSRSIANWNNTWRGSSSSCAGKQARGCKLGYWVKDVVVEWQPCNAVPCPAEARTLPRGRRLKALKWYPGLS